MKSKCGYCGISKKLSTLDCGGWCVDQTNCLIRHLEASAELAKDAIKQHLRWCDKNDWGSVPRKQEAALRKALAALSW
jgi:hypothetical protein